MKEKKDFSLGRELARKTFHMLSLIYLGAYNALGDEALFWFAAWMVFVAAVEFGRLTLPALNKLTIRLFGGIVRESERNALSGVFFSTAGCLLTVAIAGSKPVVVAAAILYLALGDSAAAITGRGLKAHPIPGSNKSWEGSFACLLTCAAIGWCLGLPPRAILAGAVAATLLEFIPTSKVFNDNLWMPAGSALALITLGGL